MKVRIKGKNIPIIRTKASEMNKCDAHGLYFPDLKKIWIKNSLGKRRFARVLMHELIHAAIDGHNLIGLIGAELEERICLAAEDIGTLLLDKNLIRFIVKDKFKKDTVSETNRTNK